MSLAQELLSALTNAGHTTSDLNFIRIHHSGYNNNSHTNDFVVLSQDANEGTYFVNDFETYQGHDRTIHGHFAPMPIEEGTLEKCNYVYDKEIA